MKCRDVLEPESIQKCRGLCLNVDVRNENLNNITSEDLFGETTIAPITTGQIEPEINNDILNMLLTSEPSRPNSFIEDKIQPDSLKVIEMKLMTKDLPDSNDIEQADEAYKLAHTPKKMAIHIGEDAANFLAKLQADQPDHHHQHQHQQDTVDLSKMKPSFKWKIGLWTRV